MRLRLLAALLAATLSLILLPSASADSHELGVCIRPGLGDDTISTYNISEGLTDDEEDACAEIIDETINGYKPVNNPNATMGYCCNIPQSTYDPQLDSPVSGWNCRESNADFVPGQDRYENKTVACQALEDDNLRQPDDEFTNITVDGVVNNASDASEPLSDVTVSVRYNGDSSITAVADETVTDVDGAYNATLTIPVDADFDGSIDITADKTGCESASTSRGNLAPGAAYEANLEICRQDADTGDGEDIDQTCGNGVVEGTEECDPGQDLDDPANYSDDIPTNAYAKRCTAQCDAVYEQQSCDTADACTARCCNNQDVCSQDAVVCQQGCRVNDLRFTELDPTYEDNPKRVERLDIGWDYQTSCETTSTAVLVENQETGQQVLGQSSLDGDQETVTFDETDVLDTGQTYTVTVSVQTASRDEPYNASTELDISYACIGKQPGTYCQPGSNTSYIECGTNGDYNADLSCGGNTVCVQQEQTSHSCVPNDCSQCSGAYELFASPLTYFLNGTGQVDNCFIEFGTENSCYYERQSEKRTTVGEAQSCGNIQTCTDYKNKQSCEANTCGQPYTESCRWVDRSQGLSKGYCVSNTTINEETCHQCGTYGCNKDLCQQLGNTSGFNKSYPSHCYFNRDADIRNGDYLGLYPDWEDNRCIAREEGGCRTYNTRQACVGSNQSRGIQEARLDDDNELIPSNDRLRYGTCEWMNTSERREESGQFYYPCVKDADDDGEPDCAGLTGTARDRCVTDNQPPTTRLTGIQDNQTLPRKHLDYAGLLITDDTYDPSNLTTHATFGSNTTTVNDTDALLDHITTNLDTTSRQEWNLTIWSQDSADNVEPKTTYNLTILQNLNEAYIETRVSKYYEPTVNDTAANLTISLRGISDARQLRCNTTVTANNGDYRRNVHKEGDGLVTTRFPVLLESDYYRWDTTCQDEFGTTIQRSGERQIDLDARITNATPPTSPTRKGRVVNTEDTTISVDTKRDRTCQYRPADEQSTDWQSFTDSDNRHHEATVNTDEERIYRYNVRCQLLGAEAGQTNPWLRGGDADQIRFGVDTTPPNVSIALRSAEDPTKTLEPGSAPNVTGATATLTCDDQPKLNASTTPYYYGCNQTVDYTVEPRSSDNISLTDTQSIDEPIDIEAFANQSQVETLHYRVTDRGGNAVQDSVSVDLLDTSLNVSINVTPER